MGKKSHHYFTERCIKVNESRTDYPNNRITTSKYNLLTFLPKNLYYQFTRLANLYFLIVGLLQLIKEISTSGGKPLIFIPLTFVLTVSALKDIVEDYKRHKSDNEENNKQTLVYKDGQFVPCKWKDIRVGNIIKVLENEYLPADVLLLQSSLKKGGCYIETKNLDGETNLKYKQVEKTVLSEFNSEEKLGSQNCTLHYEGPNVYLYKFVGSMETSQGKVPLTEQNFVLRGSSIRNTQYIIGVVAYTGHHTKIMMNSIKAKAKLSKLERNMNKRIISVMICQIIICIFAAFYAAIWYSANDDELEYLKISENSAKDRTFVYNLFVRFGNWILIFTNFVPISLVVTLEMVKLGQALILINDDKMKSKSDNIPTTVQASNLNEELGQVQMIFSDKTGTLTKNIMEFKNITINGTSYGDDRSLENVSRLTKVTNVDFLDAKFFRDLNNKKSPNYKHIRENLLLLATCHTIIVEEKKGEIYYDASSPDELALVNFARFAGAEYRGIDEQNNITIRFKGEEIKYKLLHTLEFNSTRKRMSVIIKTKEGKIVLLTKGADSIIFERLKKENPMKVSTQSLLHEYAKKGLRTLVLARREIDPKMYKEWEQRYHEASTQIHDRDEAMMRVQDEIEVELELVGATAIEDKLQDEVGLTISQLKDAGIKVWVLTGDKTETAVNIGYSCQLLTDEMTHIELTEKEHHAIEKKIDKYLEVVRNLNTETNYALIVSGDALIHISHDVKHHLAQKFIEIADSCKVVLACRVSPKQKQELVTLVRKLRPHLTGLAIGDGANDVNMIIAAHVGVGIRGLEGQQAARASDFAIGEFKILRRLLLLYGREAYRRNSYLILYNFYKNITLVLAQFWFGFHSGFSGMSIFDQYVYQLFNIFFASVPIIIYAVFDEEIDPEILVNHPEFYHQGPKDKIFNGRRFAKWFANGIWESAVIFFISFYCFDYRVIPNTEGKTLQFYAPGIMVMSCAVWVTNAKVLTMSNNFYFLNLFFVFGSMLCYALIFWICTKVEFIESYGYFSAFFGSGLFYATSILASAICVPLTIAYNRYLYHKTQQSEISKKSNSILSLSNFFGNKLESSESGSKVSSPKVVQIPNKTLALSYDNNEK